MKGKMFYKFIDKIKIYIPQFVRRGLRASLPFMEYDKYYRKSNNPYINESDEVIYEGSKIKLGIFTEFYQYHKSYIAACKELKVSYKVIDISCPYWQQLVLDSGCNAFLIWPSSGATIWKNMVDDRIRIMSEDMNLIVYPSVKEVWLYENKVRVKEWLNSQNIPQLPTWIFYEYDKAFDFVCKCNLPIVFKTNIGASASGVKILRTRRALKKLLLQAFNKGIVPRGYHPLDKQWGWVYLQEYLEGAEEWRMIRIGDSYFGYRKEKVGDFHSGSHNWSWLDPGIELLDFLKYVTDLGGFTSMDIDIFKDKNRNLYVNELQTVFGASTPKEMLMINGIEGRYRYVDKKWVFEPGDFARNQCSNLRIEYLKSII